MGWKMTDKTEIKTPNEWQKETGIIIIDPDGWREDGKSFLDEISEAEWKKRMLVSTIMSKGKYEND